MRNFLSLALIVLILLFDGCAHVRPGSGWRGDGSGKYPEAMPPLVWSTKTNVIWKTSMPSWGNASPVLTGHRIVVCSEPNEVVCVDKRDGKLLWRTAVKLSDTWSLEDRKLATAKEEETVALKKTFAELDDRINQAFAACRKNPGDKALKKRFKDLRKEQNEIRQKISANTRWAPAQTDPTNGYTSATPVTDGIHIWVVMGSGVVACLDMDGSIQWIVFLDRPQDVSGSSASPVLADGRLIVQLRNLKALDPNSGKVLWEAKGIYRKWGTPAVGSVDGIPIILTPRGQVIRAVDGKLLGKGAGALEYASPILIQEKAYFVQNGGRLSWLSRDKEGMISVKQAWGTMPKKDRYYASALSHDGLVYTVTQNNILSVISDNSGVVLESVKLPLGGKGKVFGSVTLAGKYLFVSNENGTCAVLEPGVPPRVVTLNSLDCGRATPVFEGKRMYVRTRQFLYCIGE